MKRKGVRVEYRKGMTRRIITAVGCIHSLFLCCLMLIALCVGCEGNNKKSALTEEEIARLTYAPEPERPDELIVSGETITCEDLMAAPPMQNTTDGSLKARLEELARKTTQEQFMELARPLVYQRLSGSITSTIPSIVLYKRAYRELESKLKTATEETLEKEAEKMLRQFILEEHGGNEAQADAALREMGKNRSTYKEWKKQQVLIQFFVASRYSQKRPITYRELLAQYDEMKDEAFLQEGVLQFRLIDIQTDRVELTDPNDDPVRAAQNLAQELRQRIEKGEDFAELATQYSHGHRAAMGGLWRPRNPAALAEPYDVLAGKAQELEPGQVSGPIEVPDHFFIVKLEEKQQAGYRPLNDVQEEVRRAVVKARFDAALEELGTEIVQEVALVDTSGFVDYCLERLYRVATQPTGAP